MESSDLSHINVSGAGAGTDDSDALAGVGAGVDIASAEFNKLAEGFPPISSPTAGAAAAAPSGMSSGMSSPSAAPGAMPYIFAEYAGEVVPTGADGIAMKWHFQFKGQWNVTFDPVTSEFYYNFTVVSGSYPQPPHPEGSSVKNNQLPSVHAHPLLSVKFDGVYMYQNIQPGLPVTMIEIREPSVQKKNQQPGPMVMKIGGSVPPSPAQGVPDPLTRGMDKLGVHGAKEEFLGVTGEGTNYALGSIKWVGWYHPSSGHMYLIKYWRNHAVPIQRARSVPKAREEAGAAGAPRRDAAVLDAARHEMEVQRAQVIKQEKTYVDKLNYGEGVYEKLPLEIKALEKLFLEMRNNKTKYPQWFITPVDVTVFPTYPTVVTEPMCLDDVQRKLESGAYETPDQFHRDMNLIWGNAKKFTPDPRADIHALADWFQTETGRAVKRYNIAVEREKLLLDTAARKAAEDEERKRAKEAEAAEKARRAAEKAARQAEAAERVMKSGVKRPRKSEGGPDGAGGSVDGDGGSRAGPDGDASMGLEGEGSSGMAGAHAGGAAPTTPSASAGVAHPAKKRKTEGGGGGGGGGAHRAHQSNTDLSAIAASLNSVTEAVRVMAEMQAKLLQAQSAGVSVMNPQMNMMMAGMSQMQNVLGQAVGPLANMTSAPPAPKPKGGPGRKRGPKKEEEDTGDMFVSGEDLDAYLDGEEEEYKGKSKKKAGGAVKSEGTKSRGGGRGAAASAITPAELPLTDDETSKLSEDIASLPADDTERLLQMLVDRELVIPTEEGEVELDLNKFPTEVLRELQKIVAEKLGRAVPHAALSAAPAKRGPGRPPGSGTYAGGASQRAETIAAVARVAEQNMDRISALGTLGMPASSGMGFGGYDGDDLPAPPP